jgi:bacteriocin biosynthesis cyclodehydratase domain-containing protein
VTSRTKNTCSLAVVLTIFTGGCSNTAIRFIEKGIVMRLTIDPQIEVPQYPKIPEDCHVIVEDDKILVYGIEESVVLTGENSLPIVTRLLPLLNGQNSLDDIMKSVKEEEKDQVSLILRYLYMKGLFEDYSNVAEKDAVSNDEAKRYFARLVDITRYSKNRYEVENKINAYAFQIITDCNLGMDLHTAMSQIGFQNMNILALTKNGDLSNLQNHVTAVDAFTDDNLKRFIKADHHLIGIFSRNLPQTFSSINKTAFLNNQLFTLSYLTDKTAVIGPTFIPNETGCYECYEQRYMMNVNNLDSYLSYKKFLNNDQTGPFSHTRYNKDIFINILASELVNISTFISRPQSVGIELEFDFVNLKLEKRKFYRLPVCKVCSKKITSANYAFSGEKA